MADEADKEAEAAEKAYAAAAETAPAKVEPVKAFQSTPSAAPAVSAEEKPAAKAMPAPKAKPAPKVAAPKAKAPGKKAGSVTAPAAARVPAKTKPAAMPSAAKPAKAATEKVLPKKAPVPTKPVIEAKEIFIMANTTDFTKSMTDAVSEMQNRAKAAYEKSTEMAGELGEFTKGNVEALVESGKILSEGVQDFGKTYVEEAKSAFETITADMKEMAAVKSPTELFQLQGKLMRRNFDAMVAFGSKSSEAMVKLANESIAPLSSRMSLAADKISKAA
ncbi:phasin family protein [Altererythrobacter sp. CC-YST694]|uniref:phasin family protein n=1 Tax=Altererythrobacter sp. CC-YST694 TaxID=2755038 RepID=UPI001D002F78|nr:phasin family protein [Altererythrobacter sp. CC-YST694]MCB5425849.1 phasin family protein [Altererythrobacter sp. CC-YST694]